MKSGPSSIELWSDR